AQTKACAGKARGTAKGGPLRKPCNAASACFGLNPKGRYRMRYMTVLQLLAIAPLCRVVAPCPATHTVPSHAQINC
ncbi:MAG: hypothetical protein ACXU8A_00520, partial [Burkholderiaceae bacterium]